MKCPTCHKQLDQGIAACPFCGADLSALVRNLPEDAADAACSTDMSSENVQDIDEEAEKQ